MKKLLLSIMTQMAMQMSMQVAMPLSASAQQLLPYQNANLSAEERANDLLSRLTLEEKTKLMMDSPRRREPLPRLRHPVRPDTKPEG